MKLRFLLPVMLFLALSCKKDNLSTPAVVIPNIINGTITDIEVAPVDITTPDKGTLFIIMNGTRYKVQFNAVAQAQSNATLAFSSDSILVNDSREYANLGQDVVSYNPLSPNEVRVIFYDGRKIVGQFDFNTKFGGAFGQALISQWRDANDPSKPNQKAKEDISNFVYLYDDKDGSGPGTEPTYLSVAVSKL